jgi:hypothetical protein
MTGNVTKALSREEIEAIEAKKAMEAAKPAPPSFVDTGKPRTISIPLEWPIAYDDVTYNEVVIRRPQLAEWRKYLQDCADAVMQHGPGADDNVDQPWLSVPAIVYNSLDTKDGLRVDAAQDDFFGVSSSTSEDETAPSP